MRHALDRLGIKGSVLVLCKGRPWLNYATANKADTSYLINSVQKSMTATMLMRAVQQGRLKLSDPLSKFYNINGANQVKVENLLNMTSGFDLKAGQQLGSNRFVSDADNLQNDLKKITFKPKMVGKWHYISVNYVLLCGILTQVEHRSYEQLFRSTFIKRLHLTQTEFLWSSKRRLAAVHWVPGYEKKNGSFQRVPPRTAVLAAHNELGAGSIVMSNHDLAETIQAILTGKLLTKASRKVLFKGQAKTKYYNGGFYNLPLYKEANGAGEGYYTFMRSTKNGKEMIIVQANHTKPGQFGKLRKKVNNIMSVMLRLK